MDISDMMEYENFIAKLSIVKLETFRLTNLIIEMVGFVSDELFEEVVHGWIYFCWGAYTIESHVQVPSH